MKDLNLLDRFLFAEVVEDPEVLKLMLEIILEKEIVLKSPQAEKELRGEVDGKYVKMEDGAKRIFLNTHGVSKESASQELIELLKYIETSDKATADGCSSERVKQIHHKVDAIKRSEEVGIRFMNAWEEKIIEEQKAAEKKAIEIAVKMKSMGLSYEQIKEATGLSDSKLESL